MMGIVILFRLLVRSAMQCKHPSASKAHIGLDHTVIACEGLVFSARGVEAGGWGWRVVVRGDVACEGFADETRGSSFTEYEDKNCKYELNLDKTNNNNNKNQQMPFVSG